MKRAFKILLTILFIFVPLFIYAEEEVSENNEVVSEVVTITASVVKCNNNSLIVSWDEKEGASKYLVYRSTKEKSGFKKIKEVTTTSLTDKSLTYGKTYYYKVTAVFESSKVTSAVVHAKVKPNKVENLTATAGNKKISLSYKKVSVNGYQIQRSTNNKDWSTVKTIWSSRTVTYSNTGLSTNKTYYYRVRAYKFGWGGKVYGPWSEVVSAKTAPAAPKYSVKASSYDAINVNITAAKGASYYKVYRSTSKYKNFKKIGETEELTYLDDTVEPKVTYYYKVKACNEDKKCGSYGSVYSAKTSIKTPKLSISVGVYNELSWTKVDYRTKYQIYSSTSKTGKYTKLAEVDENSYKDVAATLNKTRYYKVRLYVVVNDKKYYSSYSSVVSGKPTIAKVTGLSLSTFGSTLSVNFNTVKGVSGYQIGIATSEKGEYEFTTMPASSMNDLIPTTGMGIKEDEYTTYYVKVRAFAEINGVNKYGSFSSISHVTTGSKIPPEYEDVMAYANEILPTVYGRAELQYLLEEEGYKADEVAFAVENVDVEWTTVGHSLVEMLFEEDKYSRADVELYLVDYGYTEEEIEYILKDVDFKKIALSKIQEPTYKFYSEAKLRALLEERSFTNEEIDYAISKFTDDFTNVAYAYGMSVHFHKSISQIESDLRTAEFTEEQITAAIEMLNETAFGINYVTRKTEGTISVGDEISIGGEHFHVVSTDENETALLADAPLVVGSGASTTEFNEVQGYASNPDGSPIGRVKFSGTNYWYDEETDSLVSDYGTEYPATVYDSNSNTYTHIQNYVSLLDNLGLFSSMSGRLLTYNELMSLGCTAEYDYDTGKGECADAPAWVKNMKNGVTVWIADAANKNNIYTLSGDRLRPDYHISNYYIRPVLVVSTEDIPLSKTE